MWESEIRDFESFQLLGFSDGQASRTRQCTQMTSKPHKGRAKVASRCCEGISATLAPGALVGSVGTPAGYW
jgi:hypothetical protein